LNYYWPGRMGGKEGVKKKAQHWELNKRLLIYWSPQNPKE